jgi:hypothetical protein
VVRLLTADRMIGLSERSESDCVIAARRWACALTRRVCRVCVATVDSRDTQLFVWCVASPGACVLSMVEPTSPAKPGSDHMRQPEICHFTLRVPAVYRTFAVHQQ